MAPKKVIQPYSDEWIDDDDMGDEDEVDNAIMHDETDKELDMD